MRKRKAHFYAPLPQIKHPPHFSQEELLQFQSQFTLFGESLNLQKLKEAMQNQRFQTHTFLSKFIESLLMEKSTIKFEEYMLNMESFLQQQPQGALILGMLGENAEECISKEKLKKMLEQTIGRTILEGQMTRIMRQLFENEQKGSYMQLLAIINDFQPKQPQN